VWQSVCVYVYVCVSLSIHIMLLPSKVETDMVFIIFHPIISFVHFLLKVNLFKGRGKVYGLPNQSTKGTDVTNMFAFESETSWLALHMCVCVCVCLCVRVCVFETH
jgi:hypothetical protein